MNSACKCICLCYCLFSVGIVLFPLIFCTWLGSVILSSALNDQNILEDIDPAQSFENIGQVCTIQSIHLTSYTIEIDKSVYCRDYKSYKFTIMNGTERYSSEKWGRDRNRIDGTKEQYPDQCSSGDDNLESYDEFSDEAGNSIPCSDCQIGDVLECWQPTNSTDICSNNDESCSRGFSKGGEWMISWPDCGNDQCKKLVDPIFSYNDLLHYVKQEYNKGLRWVCICSAVWMVLLFGCCKNSLRNYIQNMPSMNEIIESGNVRRVQRHLMIRGRRTAYMPLPLTNTLPIHLAAKRGVAQVVKLLLEAYPGGASSTDHHGRLPLHYAARNGSIVCVKLLLDTYPDGIHVANRNGIFPYMDAIRYARNASDDSSIDVVQLLLQENNYADLFVPTSMRRDD